MLNFNPTIQFLKKELNKEFMTVVCVPLYSFQLPFTLQSAKMAE